MGQNHTISEFQRGHLFPPAFVAKSICKVKNTDIYLLIDAFDYNFIGFQMLPVITLFVFRAFDHNGDGSISRDELLDALRRFGHSFSEAECDEMFTQVNLATSLGYNQ